MKTLSAYFMAGISTFALSLGSAQAQTAIDGRKTVSLDQDWHFAKDPKDLGVAGLEPKLWQELNLPHSWNIDDVMDDEPGYYRDASWYTRKLKVDPAWKGKRLLLYIGAANQEADVFVNGHKLANHKGGYTAFQVDISEQLDFSEGGVNELAIRVDNRHQADIPPLSADFTFFGGLYRQVKLLLLDPIHFDDSRYGGSGLSVWTENEQEDYARIRLKGQIRNQGAGKTTLKIVSELWDPAGQAIKRVEKGLEIGADGMFDFADAIDSIAHPKLWTPDTPNLYRLSTSIFDADGHLLDRLTNTVGFRWFSFDADKGFFLNGKSLKLIGASRHQDYKGMGNGVPDSLQVEDLHLLKAMGGNFLRVAHYPQDPAILKACDSLGILASVEIPIVNEITESEAFFANSLHMQKEMIRQYHNHPSIIIWAYMNEVFLRPHFPKDKARQDQYFEETRKLAQALDDLTRAEDPRRYTMIANHGNFDVYHRTGLTQIPMVVGWNLYPGWYGGKINDFAGQLERIHERLPNKPLIVTEYGADADDRIHSVKPIRFDKSVEYAIQYHQGYLHDILTKDFVAGAAAWNLADFNSETRAESMPHMNTKGLLTWDRRAKDSYLLYQAYLLKEPFVAVGVTAHGQRMAKSTDGKGLGSLLLPLYSNADSVAVQVNGKDARGAKLLNRMAEIPLQVRQGSNRVSVRAFGTDGRIIASTQSAFQVTLIPSNLREEKDWTSLRVNVGDNRYYTDEAGQAWFPDQAYTQGGWGYVGGTAFRLKNTGRKNLGADANIRETADDPLFQTQRQGLSAYRFDLPDGRYSLDLYFAELEAASESEGLLYDLEQQGKKRTQTAVDRVFRIWANGKTLKKGFSIVQEAGAFTKLKQSYEVRIKNGKGLLLEFSPKAGQTVLNAVEIRKK